MKDVIPCKSMANTDEKSERKVICEEQKVTLKALFIEASKITFKTPQREICSLLSKTANYILSSTYYIFDARQLHLKLSNCLKSQCDNHPWGFDELTDFIHNSDFMD